MIIQAFHLLLGFAENQGIFSDFKIQNSIRITEGLDNGDSDNRGSTVHVSEEFWQINYNSKNSPLFYPSGILLHMVRQTMLLYIARHSDRVDKYKRL